MFSRITKWYCMTRNVINCLLDKKMRSSLNQPKAGVRMGILDAQCTWRWQNSKHRWRFSVHTWWHCAPLMVALCTVRHSTSCWCKKKPNQGYSSKLRQTLTRDRALERDLSGTFIWVKIWIKKIISSSSQNMSYMFMLWILAVTDIQNNRKNC